MRRSPLGFSLSDLLAILMVAGVGIMLWMATVQSARLIPAARSISLSFSVSACAMSERPSRASVSLRGFEAATLYYKQSLLGTVKRTGSICSARDFGRT